MDWFSTGIDPLINFLKKRLTGIPILSHPDAGPSEEPDPNPLPPLEEKFILMAFWDDLKQALTPDEELEQVYLKKLLVHFYTGIQKLRSVNFLHWESGGAN